MKETIKQNLQFLWCTLLTLRSWCKRGFIWKINNEHTDIRDLPSGKDVLKKRNILL